jgi:hypothetical protein
VRLWGWFYGLPFVIDSDDAWVDQTRKLVASKRDYR